MEKLTELLKQMSMRGTVRWTIGAMDKQGQLSWFTQNDGLRVIHGTVEEIMQKLQNCVETGEPL